MIRLNLKREPEWIELVAGVRVLVRPLRSVILAEAAAAPRLRELPADVDRDVRFAILCSEIAQLTIVEWEGVGDAEGKPVDPSPEGIAALMDLPMIAQAFSARYVTPGLLVSAEKNA
jgi:hypothetical protein